MKLLLDENLSPQHARELRSEGYDACAVAEIGLSGKPDEHIRQYAIDTGRILLTLDADFANIVRFPPEKTPGVMRLKVHPPTEERIRQTIRRALLQLRDANLTGCLAVVDADKIRIRR